MPDLRWQLVTALTEVPGTETLSGRTALLRGIPRNLIVGINRSPESIRLDLDLVTTQFDQLGPLDSGEQPLVIIASNAAELVAGTALGRRLQELRLALENDYGAEAPLPELSFVPEVLASAKRAEWVDHDFVQQAAAASRQVARLAVSRRNGGHGIGTGWLVASNLVLTNHHVVRARGKGEPVAILDEDVRWQAAHTAAWFDYFDAGGEPVVVAATELVAYDIGLDYALVRLDNSARLGGRGHMRLAPDVPLEQGTRLNIVQCPGGGPLRFAIRNNFFVGTGPRTNHIRYVTDTMEGSSGSPVLDDQWRVVALHRGAHAVDPQAISREDQTTPVLKFHNMGVGIHAVLAHLPEAPRQEILAAQRA
ncbi:endonuclease G [Bradyrhizobium japonicum]